MNATGTQTVVIVGAGLAGGNAAVTLRQEGWQGRIVLLGSEPTIPFGRPPLSKTYLRGEEDLSGWYVKPADWYGEHNIELRTNTTVRRVDTAQRQLQLEDGTALDYDRLVLCTGGSNRQLEVPGASLPGIYQLRSLAQCEAIRQAARPGAHALIVGMGFIGAEVAASLRQMGLDVTAVLPGAAPLASVLGNEVASVLASIHSDSTVAAIQSLMSRPNSMLASSSLAAASNSRKRLWQTTMLTCAHCSALPHSGACAIHGGVDAGKKLDTRSIPDEAGTTCSAEAPIVCASFSRSISRFLSRPLSILRSGHDRYTMTVDLTIKGTTQPVMLKVDVRCYPASSACSQICISLVHPHLLVKHMFLMTY